MEDFGYRKTNKNNKKGYIAIAVLFSFIGFFYVVLQSYDFISNNDPTKIDIIEPRVANIKTYKEQPESEQNNSIYENILNKRNENIKDYQANKAEVAPYEVQNPANLPKQIKEPAIKPAQQEQKKIRVQIAAMSSEESAKDYWQKLNKSHNSLLKKYQYFIEKADLGTKGIFFRLQIGDFTSKEVAESFCQQFVLQSKKTKADCIILH